MTATQDDMIAELQRANVDLQQRLAAALARRDSDYNERIEHQAATIDVLLAMSASPEDPQPVFDLISVRARDICGAYGVTVCEFDGSLLHWRAATGISEDPAVREAAKAAFPTPPTRDMAAGRAILNRAIVHIRDHETEPGLRRFSLTVKSSVVVPLMRGGVPIGTLQMGSRERGGFSDTQVELLKTFAEQAVIAIGSAETYRTLQTRTTDLQESLQFQTATAEVLRVIASSPTDVKPVLTGIVESACKLCEASDAYLALKDGDHLVFQTQHGLIPVAWKRRPINRQWPAGRAVVDGKSVHLLDVLAGEGDEFPDGREIARHDGARTVLTVPLMREGEGIGVIILRRTEVLPFTDKQIALLQTFADQAVIAIGNVRLFDEVQAKTRDLEAALEQESAGSEVLKLISMSSGDLEPVFQKLLESATRLCGAELGIMNLLSGGMVRQVSFYNMPEVYVSEWSGKPYPPHPESVMGTVMRTRQAVHVDDLRTRPAYSAGNPAVVALSDIAGARTYVGVPMLQRDELVGMISIYRREVRPFDEKQVQLVERFASQAVIALENARLLNELRERTHQLSRSLENLRATQDRLIQTEKLASLGQLTAGIAHEIKNPLNFVNNFSALSAELVGEMGNVLAEATLDKKSRDEMDELAQMLKSNLEKVVQHGKRADSIVKNMLLHSREGSGEHRPVDINAIVDESLNLAYHGARAEKADFSIAFQRDLDPTVGMVDVYPQEITRVLLNLISNGFYAATKRKAEASDGFEPTLSAATKNLGDKVEIRIRDNGTGIPEEVKEKIFNPFFTTKPSGEGTGLGLSMSHDIIVKQHGGSIDVETEPGLFTEIKIVLPRTSQR
jgi:two-component system, NtrC family, sensor kinase